MLSIKNRFHGHGSVRRVYRQGHPVRHGMFGLHVNSHPRVRTTRVAVVVSKKVNKSAVKRNRIRRKLYEVIRLRLEKINNPTEIVVTVYKPEIAEIEHDKLESMVDDAFEKANLYN